MADSITDELDPDDELLDSEDIEGLQADVTKAQRRLRNARKAEQEKRSIVDLTETVKDLRKNYDQTLERLTGYDTNDKARLFGYGAFTGAGMDAGNLKYVRMDSVFAFEVEAPSADSAASARTWLRTVDGAVDVAESADEIMNEFQRVRLAYQFERVQEVESELTRNKLRVEEREEKKKGATRAIAAAEVTLADLISTGPDFGAVSDGLSDDGDPDGDSFFDGDPDDIGIDNDESDWPVGSVDDDDSTTTDNGGIH